MSGNGPYHDTPSSEEKLCAYARCPHDASWETEEGYHLCEFHAEQYLRGDAAEAREAAE